MTLLLSEQPMPLRSDARGVIRIGKTRVSLDSVVYAYQSGATAEQICDDFPTLDLADIYTVIGYYLRHRKNVTDYLANQRQKATDLRARIEADPKTQIIRERLLQRRSSPVSAARRISEPEGCEGCAMHND